MGKLVCSDLAFSATSKRHCIVCYAVHSLQGWKSTTSLNSVEHGCTAGMDHRLSGRALLQVVTSQSAYLIAADLASFPVWSMSACLSSAGVP